MFHSMAKFSEFKRRLRIATLLAFFFFALGCLLSVRIHPAQAPAIWVLALRSVVGPMALFVPVLILSELLSRVDRILVIYIVGVAVGSALAGSVFFALLSSGLHLAPILCVAAIMVPVTTWVCWGMKYQRG